jgi:hypothetical protein
MLKYNTTRQFVHSVVVLEGVSRWTVDFIPIRIFRPMGMFGSGSGWRVGSAPSKEIATVLGMRLRCAIEGLR